jgi:hypothetical protein
MAGMNSGDAYEFDPETYGGEGGGLPGMLQQYMQQQSQQQEGVDFGSTPTGAPEYDAQTSFNPHGGMLGRLLSLQAESSQYRPIPGDGGQMPSGPRTSDFGQTPQTRITVRPVDAYSRLPDSAPLRCRRPGPPHLRPIPRHSRQENQRWRGWSAESGT